MTVAGVDPSNVMEPEEGVVSTKAQALLSSTWPTWNLW